ncbi:MAG: SURF1 family protein [Paracoccaceae bacterium]
MNRSMIFPLVFGLVGTVIFLSLGVWQLQRLTWKTAILTEIDMRLAEEPVALPVDLDSVIDKYLQVEVSGVIEPRELHVLTFGDGTPGFRVISTMVLLDGRRILVDRGFLPEIRKTDPRMGGEATALGSLVWPQETDKYVPAPNLEKNIWFARDVPLMAKTLNTEEIMLAISRNSHDEGITPQRVSVNISNRHLEYVMTWFSLAVIWVGMTGYALRRIKHKTE